MHILMITTDHLMIDRRILQEAETLRRAGCRITLLAGFECAQPTVYDRDGIRIERFCYDWSDTRVERVLSRVALKPGKLRTQVWIALRRAIVRATGLTSFEHYVLRQVLAHDYDVLHCHDYPLLGVAVAAIRRRKTPLVYDAHELYHAQVQLPMKTRRAYAKRERSLIYHADLAITVNPFIARIMGRDYKVRVPEVILNAAQPLGADAGTGLRERLALPADEPIVLYQGWMSPERGIDVLVRAARHFPKTVHLVLAGYGAHEAELRAISAADGTDDGRVVFLGEIPNDELMTLTRSADLGVIPYHGIDLNNYYCSPNKLFEYAVAGVPFLSNDLPFLRSVAERYGFGVVANLRAPEATAEAILGIVQNPSRLADLRGAAAKAATELNWDVEARKLLGLYNARIVPRLARASRLALADAADRPPAQVSH